MIPFAVLGKTSRSGFGDGGEFLKNRQQLRGQSLLHADLHHPETLQMMTLCLLPNLKGFKRFGEPKAAVEYELIDLLRFMEKNFVPLNAMMERAGMSELDIYHRSSSDRLSTSIKAAVADCRVISVLAASSSTGRRSWSKVGTAMGHGLLDQGSERSWAAFWSCSPFAASTSDLIQSETAAEISVSSAWRGQRWRT